ncbi:MAG: O-antigen ligase family protein, partial [bacterium]|nr:O-antigen ligase family protein [bacterium]
SLLILFLLFCMFPLGYLESLRWPFPGPRATHGLLKGLFLVLSVVMIVFRKQLGKSKNPVQSLLMVFFLLAYTFSAAFSQAPSSSLLNLWYPFISFSILYAFSLIKIERKYIYLLIALSSILVFLTFIFSFFSLLFRYSVDNIYYFMFLEHRANHLLQELRFYGKYVSLGPYIFFVPLATTFLIEKGSSLSRKGLSIFMLLVSVLIAVISNNRIDFLIIAFQLLCVLFLLPKKLAVTLLIAVIPIIYFGLMTTELFFGFSLEERLLRPKIERDIETVDIRFTYWETALYNFQKFPIFGTGPNTYNDVSVFPIRRYYNQGAQDYLYRIDEGIGIHNVFFERLSDTGLAGFITFITLLLFFARKDFLEIIRRKDPESRKIYFLFALSSWTWIMYGITDNGYGAQGFVTFFFLRGVVDHV